MKCEICHQHEATITIKGDFDGQSQKELHICEECASKQGLNVVEGIVNGLGLADLLHSMSEKMAVETAGGLSLGMNEKVKITCPKCGMNMDDLKKKGKLGCEECYDAFSSVLMEALADMHKGVVHFPRTKSNVSRPDGEGVVNLTLEVSRLQKSLEIAVAEERFEEAAALRDQIQEVKNKLKEFHKLSRNQEDN